MASTTIILHLALASPLMTRGTGDIAAGTLMIRSCVGRTILPFMPAGTPIGIVTESSSIPIIVTVLMQRQGVGDSTEGQEPLAQREAALL